MFDIASDNTSDTSDYIGVAFDENHDGYFNSWWGDNNKKGECYVEAYKVGVSYALPDDRFSICWGFAKSPNENTYKHEIVEISMPISNFNYDTTSSIIGQTMGFHVEGTLYSEVLWSFPQNSTRIDDLIDEATPRTLGWGNITLSSYVGNAIPPPPAVQKNWAGELGIAVAVIGIVVIVVAVLNASARGMVYAPTYVAIGTGIALAAVGVLLWNGNLGAVHLW
jgi:hypothetical protein